MSRKAHSEASASSLLPFRVLLSRLRSSLCRAWPAARGRAWLSRRIQPVACAFLRPARSRVHFLVGGRLCRFRCRLSCCRERSVGTRVLAVCGSSRGAFLGPLVTLCVCGQGSSPCPAAARTGLWLLAVLSPWGPALRVPCSRAGEAVVRHSLGSGLRFLGYQRPPASSLVLLVVRQPWRHSGSGPLPFSMFAPLGCLLLSCRFVCFSWKFLGMLC